MKSRAEDSLSIKNKEANNHFLRKVCKSVSSLPATSLPPVTKLRMSGTFCAQPEESTPDLLRSRKTGILWSGGLGAAAPWLWQTEGRRSKGAALFWVCSWSNQSCWLTCISILKVQANKFLKGWKGYISSNWAGWSPVPPSLGDAAGDLARTGPGSDREAHQACGFSVGGSVDMNNPQHIGWFECTFMIRSHFTPLLFPHATRTPPLPSELCAVQDGCSDLPPRQGSPSSANSQDPLFVPSVPSAVTPGLRSSAAWRLGNEPPEGHPSCS